MVTRDTPVAWATLEIPPHPRAVASAAKNNLRCFSLRWGKTVFNLVERCGLNEVRFEEFTKKPAKVEPLTGLLPASPALQGVTYNSEISETSESGGIDRFAERKTMHPLLGRLQLFLIAFTFRNGFHLSPIEKLR